MMTEREKLLNEALNACKKSNYNGIILLPTGTGKGKLMIDCMKNLNAKKILYLSDTRLLRDVMFKEELIKWNAANYIKYITFMCYQSSHKLKNEKYDLILADEFDASLTPTRKAVFYNNEFKHKILVSATLDDDKRKQAKEIAPIIFEKTPTEVINRKVLNKVEFYKVYYNLNQAENREYLNYNKRFKALLQDVQNKLTKFKLEKLQIERKHFLNGLDSSAHVTNRLLNVIHPEKVLVFCGLSKQADRIGKYSYHSGSKANNLEKFNKGDISQLSVVNKVDRGLNINSVRVIVHESIGRSKTRMTQRNGRGMRLNIEDTLKVYFLIPRYRNFTNTWQPTIVDQWVTTATKDMKVENIKIINYKHND